MRYIDRTTVSISSKYSKQLNAFAVDIRGKLHRNDIYFNQENLEQLFGRALNPLNAWRMVWIEIDQTRLKYLCYDELIAQFHHHRARLARNGPVFQFVSLINTILDDESANSVEHEDEFDIQSRPSETNSFCSYSIIQTNEYEQPTIAILQHRIELLAQMLETKDRELQIKDRDLTILRLRMGIELSEKNECIDSLRRQLECINDADDADRSEWV
jgi:hypothetical protein